MRAAYLLVLWGKLSDIEHQARRENQNCARLWTVRQKEAKPVLKEIKTILKEYKPQALPKSSIGKAIAHSLNQWEALNRYVDDPMLEINNNLSE